MTKKLYIPIIASLLAIPAVLAQQAPDPVSMLRNLFEKNIGWLFVDFTGTAGSMFWLRFMLWIVLFAAYYAVLIGVVPNFKARKNTALPVALVMAIISVVFIPNGILTSIGKAYGITVTFLLMGLPIGAAIYIMHSAFPTGRTDSKGAEIPVARRKVNHAIRAILYYLIFTLLGNYITAFAKDPIFSRDATIVAPWGAMAESFAMIMMIYHLLAAIFVSQPAEGAEAEEGWLMRMIRERRPAAPGEERRPAAIPEADLGPMEARITNLNNAVNIFEQITRDFMDSVQAYLRSAANDRDDAFENILNMADAVRTAGENVEVAAADLTGDAQLFARLHDRHYVQIQHIMARYASALEAVINSISDATG